jgi:hypothetical protein
MRLVPKKFPGSGAHFDQDSLSSVGVGQMVSSPLMNRCCGVRRIEDVVKVKAKTSAVADKAAVVAKQVRNPGDGETSSESSRG